MNKTRISFKNHRLTKDYSQKTIANIWIKQSPKTGRNLSFQHFLSEEKEKEKLFLKTIQEASQVLIIATPILEHRELIKALLAACNEGVRVYVLVGEARQLKPLAGKVFIKTGFDFQGSFILSDPTNQSKGAFLNDSFRKDTFIYENMVFEMDELQINEFYQLFCHWFWNRAPHQILHENQLAHPPKAEESPYGDIPLTKAHHLPELLDTIYNGSSEWVLSNLNSKSPYQQGKNKSVITSYLGNEDSFVIDLTQDGSEVLAFAQDFIPKAQFAVVSQSEAWLFPSKDAISKDYPYLIRLNKLQSTELYKYKNQIKDQAEYKFSSLKTYTELEGESFYTLTKLKSKNTVVRNERLTQIIPEVSLGDLENPIWENYLEEKELLACRVDYDLELHPIVLPNGATPDRLYADWKKIENNGKGKIEELKFAVAQLNDKQKTIGDRLKSFLGSFRLGKNTKYAELKRKIETLSTAKVLTIRDGKQLYAAINKIVTEINEETIELNDELAEAKAKADHHDQISRAKEELKVLEKEESELKNKRIALEEQQVVERAQLRTEQAEKQTAFLLEYFGISAKEEYKIKEEYTVFNQQLKFAFTTENWSKIRSTISLKKGEVKKNRKQFKKNALVVKHIEMLNSEAVKIDDMPKVLERQFQGKFKEIDKQISNFADKIKRKKLETEKEFVYDKKTNKKISPLARMQKRGKKKVVSNENQGIEFLKPQEIPNEELPTVGELFTYQKNRYLTIDFWEEYAEAVTEKERLNIRTICIKNQ